MAIKRALEGKKGQLDRYRILLKQYKKEGKGRMITDTEKKITSLQGQI